MRDIIVDVAIIGGGPAGLAAAISARDHGAENVLVIDRNTWLGGILPQCIHDGFGVTETGKDMTGPEYSEMYLQRAKDAGVELLTETMVLEIDEKDPPSDEHTILATNPQGLHTIHANSIILATGCREKTRWHYLIPGSRPSGLYTAGVAQAFVNLYNKRVGKNVVILGSGDVGLIMARRMKLEGAESVTVVEAMPQASGLPRNVVQCLEDYDIPLLLGHTVTRIIGKERLEAVDISAVDENIVPVHGTARTIQCDTLLLSLGLIPENELGKSIGIELDHLTGGPLVNQDNETSVPGVFACGNSLHVHDTVDLLAVEAKHAGKMAAEYAEKRVPTAGSGIAIIPGEGVRYAIPQNIDRSGTVEISMRAQRRMVPAGLRIWNEEGEVAAKKLPLANPPNMIKIKLEITEAMLAFGKSLEVSIHEQ